MEKNLDNEQLKRLYELILDGKLGIVDASIRLGIHKQTLHEKLIEYINTSNDIELKRKYIKYEEKRNPDYSFINFKALFIQMVKDDVGQSEMAREYCIPARTISRELDKIKEEEGYEVLYEMTKEVSKRKMCRQKFSTYERVLMCANIENYDEGPVIINNSISKEYKRAKELLEKVSKMQGTKEEIARKLGIGVSTIRRAKKRIDEYEKKQETKKILEEKEGEER
jgi:hypothetical protein